MSETLFTIITVTRNNLDGLRRTYDSVMAQHDELYDWLVIDGDSHDGTKDFLKSHNIPHISEPDSGIYDAMNKGIERASGLYIIFMNAGDVFADNQPLLMIADTLSEMTAPPQFMYGDALETLNDDRHFYKKAKPYGKISGGMFTHHQAMFYRTNRLQMLRYDTQYKIAADYKLTLEYLLQTKKEDVLYCPFPICIFEKGGISQQNTARGRREQFEIRHKAKIVPPLINYLITARQAVMSHLRSVFPALYVRLRSSGNNGNGHAPE